MPADSIRVVCRFRPQNSKELARGGKSVVEFKDEQTVRIEGPETGDHSFSFDKCFVPSVTQAEVYNTAALPVVQDIFRGYNGTVFVYGQTSSGKTHTMMGPDGGKGMDDPEMKGIIPRMVKTIFDQVDSADENIEFLVKVSYIEIYMEKIRDLLDSDKSNLAVRESKQKGIYVDGATEVYVSCEEDVLDVMRTGTGNRAVGATNMNAESSRSHSLFVVKVQQKDVRTNSVKHGKLYLVDLAGSEKVGKTGAAGQTLDEAKMINKSLSALGNVINALTDGKSKHVPYRDSKLTRILQEALGGNSKTTLIINCSPSNYNEAETVSTLRFGTRAKSIKNQAKVNEDKSVAEYKIIVNKMTKETVRLKGYISTLEKELIIVKGGGEGTLQISNGQASEQGEGGDSAIGHLHARIEELEAKVKNYHEEKKRIVEELGDTVDRLAEREAEIEMQADRLEAMTAAAKERKEEASTLKAENGKLIQKMATVNIELDSLKEQAAAHGKELGEAVALKEQLQQEKADMTARIAGMESAIGEAQADRKRTELKEERMKELNVDIVSWEETEQSLRDELEAVYEPAGFSSGDEGESLAEELAASLMDAEFAPAATSEPAALASTKLGASTDSVGEKPGRRDVEQMRAEAKSKMAEFDEFKKVLMRDLQEQCARVVDLELLLEEAKEQMEALLNNVKSRSLYKKNAALTAKLKGVTDAHKDLLAQHESLTVEKKLADHKLSERDAELAVLRQELKEMQDMRASEAEQKQKELAQYRQLLEAARKRPRTNSHSGRNIAVPMRGGGGRKPKQRESGGFFGFFRSSSSAPKVEEPKKEGNLIEMSDASDVFSQMN